MSEPIEGRLILEDGAEFRGTIFGNPASVSGEVVFTTGMVGYSETVTDPSFRGQIVVFTYPLIGNYGVPAAAIDSLGLSRHFESVCAQAAGVVVANLSHDTSHWSAARSFHEYLAESGVSGITDVDTRTLTQHLRSGGSILGKIVVGDADIPFDDPNSRNLVAEVSTRETRDYGSDGPRVVLVDTGVKTNIIRQLVAAGARVRRVPWNHDFFDEPFDGLFIGNGPGNPKMVEQTIGHLRRALADRIPTFGICLGHQLLALAAGADTYKLKFGHRSQNQPCVEIGTNRCYITSQNHGFAVNGDTLPEGWRQWFVNANDGTNEGIRHEYKPVRSVQFHPEAAPGPRDTLDLFHRFLEMIG
ncbi:MAG: glutamine-hydrolyzing carbamoyl-phosphate synthase small subunit [Phycisphaerales bacterium]|nr:glutamine-hydrolyzing carbamoyl-phosphate synthase small subunit [Phycisphaerales bacterium]MCB9856898.1 glutamine-hydrolyzing carbamoyl-phosphate synthase small subunit [Phycisphaerales bacterium]MCB9861975.1 glutamine-hydrolyzing carbamoyl-phosphate synthase small subunit [Phycisphaerales bacterium]